MNRRLESHLFWGSHSPLASLAGAALVITASSRFAFALVCAGALVWVYALTALIYSYARGIMPVRGKTAVLLFLSTFLSGIFMLLVGMLNPLLIVGSFLFLLLVPPCCLGSGLFEEARSAEPVDIFVRSLQEAIVLSLVILGAALVREPLGMGTLSFPGGVQGIIELFGDSASFVPLRILSVSGGGLLLLGYGTALYRFLREQAGGIPEEEK